ncbi:methylmalonyl-CoA mutase family protein [uncultured Roseibium sp.]|uniref:methylmalonyl-CoA mutase family protein n=1 Tax=uncultured Roseibium sp. TaxID=1936171 RepID=UPI00260B4621|nr:methylmalonyl-CoA mutase family protein [uncultured Roseibium sp.]
MPNSFTGPDSFYSADEDAWWASVDKALKGQSRDRLFGQTEDGFDTAPLYPRRSDTASKLLRAGDADWSVVQRIDIPDPSEANLQILDDLNGGASGLDLIFFGASSSYGSGIQVEDLASIETLLKDVQLDLISLRFDAGRENMPVLAALFAHLEKQGLDPATVNITAGFDPYSWIAENGVALEDMEHVFRHFRDAVGAAHGLGSPVRLMKADGRVWHEAGATPAQELALVLASAAAHLRMLEDTHLPPENWSDRISMSLIAEADQFGTIAKARAVRALWACVLDGAGLPQSSMQLHMSTSFRMLTQRDPWVNLLRNTVATFAAGVGGADSICVLPHTLAVGLPDAFARRIARNTQSILLEESSLSKVMDPSAGSGAIEGRTDSLCEVAWKLFQEIEAAGGLVNAIRSGLVHDQIEAARTDLQAKVARRKRPVTGVSEFPDLSEKAVEVLQTKPQDISDLEAPPGDLPEPGNGERLNALKALALQGHSLRKLGMRLDLVPRDTSLRTLDTGRIAEPFERLRSVAEDYEAQNASPPKIFLASLGSLAQFTARATWSVNAFAAGGIEAVGPQMFETRDQLIAAFKQSGTPLACLVSSDAVYETEAIAVALELKEAGASHLYLAGKPGEREKSYTEAGIDTYLYAGCDLLSLLETAHKRLNTAADTALTDLEVRG